MKQLKIKDNDQRKKEEFFDILGLAKTIANKTLEELEKEGVFVFPEMVRYAEDVTREQMILRHNLSSAIRKGSFKAYVQNEYNDGNVKGTINIDRNPRTGKNGLG